MNMNSNGGVTSFFLNQNKYYLLLVCVRILKASESLLEFICVMCVNIIVCAYFVLCMYMYGHLT